MYIYIYIYIYILKLASVVEIDQKAPFSIATSPKCKGGHYAFPGLLHFTIDMYLILLSIKQGGIKYHFKVFGMMRPAIDSRSPGTLANTLLTRQYIYIYIYIIVCVCVCVCMCVCVCGVYDHSSYRHFLVIDAATPCRSGRHLSSP